jgi:Zn-dependent alcohol dehydrogenase
VNSTGPIKAAVVPTTTRITSGSKTFVFGSGAIGGTTIQAVIAAGFIGAVMYTWYWKQHPAKFSGGV